MAITSRKVMPSSGKNGKVSRPGCIKTWGSNGCRELFGKAVKLEKQHISNDKTDLCLVDCQYGREACFGKPKLEKPISRKVQAILELAAT